MIIIEGTLESILYRNDKNSYTVAKLLTEDGLITVVGYFSLQPMGAKMKCKGDIVFHKKYGEQFQVKKILNSEMSYSNNMEAYLKSGAIDYIGPTLAKRIVEKFKEETYDVFKNHPEKLLEVKGVGKKTYEKIMASFNSQIDLQDVMIELANYGIGVSLSNKLFQKYGDGILEIIRTNPYKLIDEKIGIGFKIADEIAKEAGFKDDDENRIEAAMVYILKKASNDGHCYLPLEILVDRTSKLLNLNEEKIRNCIKNFAGSRDVKIEIIDGTDACYDNFIYNSENYIALKLNQLLREEHPDLSSDIESRIRMKEALEDIKFAKNQEIAIIESFKSGVLIITGGPGTGKTTTLNTIISIAEELGMKYSLCAPTGRAAKRISESTGEEAKTLHRLLEYKFNGYEMEFEKGEENQIDSDIIIVDEMSMVDTVLFSQLLKAVKEKTRLILVGDSNQILSVGAGNVLKDLINSKMIKVVELDRVFRQKNDSMIVENAHKINHGEFPILNKKDSDFFMFDSRKPDDSVNLIKELVGRRLKDYYNLDPLSDIQVLAPMKKGPAGIENLNYELQNAMNPPDFSKPEIIFKNKLFRLGDKVMQTKNDYEATWKAYTEEGIVYDSGEGIYNGDIGIVTAIDRLEEKMVVKYDEREVEYNEENLSEVVLAYAITIHKSQGSEFPAVIIPVHYTPHMLGNRNLIYTAITRAKRLVVLVGENTELKKMIDNTFINRRFTGLKLRMSNFYAIFNK